MNPNGAGSGVLIFTREVDLGLCMMRGRAGSRCAAFRVSTIFFFLFTWLYFELFHSIPYFNCLQSSASKKKIIHEILIPKT